VGGLGAAWLFNKSADRAAERTAKAYEEAKQASERVDSILQKAQDLERLQQEAKHRAEELKELQDELMKDLDSTRNGLKALQQEMGQTKKGVDRNLLTVKRALEVIQVDEYGMNTFSDDASQRQQAIMGLIEMSNRESAIIRRRCVRIFGALEEFNQAAADRLAVMIEKDLARGVRKEAEESLRRLKSRKPPRDPENIE
jgi:chromosome segregation ATPase